MKCAMFALILCVVTPAICQSAAPAPSNPLQLFQTPPDPAKPWMDFVKPLSLPPFTLSTPLRQFIVPKTGAATRWDDAQIDPKIIVHPPQSKLGVQPTGIIIATNQFPNLRFMPIASPGSSAHAIPAQWPGSSWKRYQQCGPNLSCR